MRTQELIPPWTEVDTTVSTHSTELKHPLLFYNSSLSGATGVQLLSHPLSCSQTVLSDSIDKPCSSHYRKSQILVLIGIFSTKWRIPRGSHSANNIPGYTQIIQWLHGGQTITPISLNIEAFILWWGKLWKGRQTAYIYYPQSVLITHSPPVPSLELLPSPSESLLPIVSISNWAQVIRMGVTCSLPLLDMRSTC